MPSPRRRLAIEILMWLFVWLPLLVGLIALIGWAFSSPDEEARIYLFFFLFLWGPLGLVILGTLGLLATYAIQRYLAWLRRNRAMTILAYLENAIRLNFPLDTFLRAAEESESDKTRRRIGDLRRELSRGTSVGSALAAAVPEISPDLLGALCAGEAIGQRQPTLARLLKQESLTEIDREQQTPPFYRFYLPLMAIATLGMTFFFSIYVVPKFRDIFIDLHTTLPPVTQFMIDLTNSFDEGDLGLIFFIALALLLLATLARAIQRWVQRLRDKPRTPTFYPGLDALPWYVPLWRRLLRDRAIASLLEFLADALRAHLPLPEALSASLILNLPFPIRTRMIRWRDAIIAGKTPEAAARTAGLPELLTGFLQTPRPGESHTTTSATPELFDFLASYYRERFSRLTIFLRAAAEPAAVLFMGAIVGLFVYAMFSPLVKLIDSMVTHADRGIL